MSARLASTEDRELQMNAVTQIGPDPTITVNPIELDLVSGTSVLEGHA